MKFLVTGAAGFVGQTLCHELVRRYGSNGNNFLFMERSGSTHTHTQIQVVTRLMEFHT